jgi:hypothetical protein
MIRFSASKLISEGGIIDVITLDDAEELVTEELSRRKNLKKFCREHSLCYANVVAIKTGKGNKKYPLLVQQLLRILFSFETEEIKLFKITKTQTE